MKLTFKYQWRGDAKFKKIVRFTEAIGGQSLARGMDNLVKRRIVALAPTPHQERTELSQGTAIGHGLIGTFAGGRFLKSAGQKYVQTALAEEPVKIVRHNSVVKAQFGDIYNLNQKVGFSWMISDGTLRSTQQNRPQIAWGSLIQFWENGGQFIVTSRDLSRYNLRPEDGVSVPLMTKKIKGRHMFENGYKAMKKTLSNQVGRDIRRGVPRSVN